MADSRPAFAAIAAVICVGVTLGRRGERAVQLTIGVWELAASYDDPPRAELARRGALAAAARAENLEGARPELVGQVRSTAGSCWPRSTAAG